MSNNKKAKLTMTGEIPADVAAYAQNSIDQAQAAFEKANDLAHGNVQVFDAAASAYKFRFADIQMKAMEITQINLNAGFAFARKIFAVKEPAELFALHQTFAREQAQAFHSQATELSELNMALAKETVKPLQDGFSKSLGDVSKSFAA
ncbi:MAG: phasin family protein [Aestuariivirga sp.]